MSAALQTHDEKYKARQARIADLRTLEEGWDSYGGMAPTRKALREGESVLRSYDLPYLPGGYLIPLSDGGLQVEWHCGQADVELEISPQGYIGEVSYCEQSGEWQDGDFLDHAEAIRQLFERMNERCRVKLLADAAAQGGQAEDELLRLREALLAIVAVDNTHVICGRCRGDREQGECGCFVAVDADEKARQLALQALRLKEVR